MRWPSGKESTCQCRRHKRGEFNPRVRKIPLRRKWQPTLVFLPGKFHGQRSLAGYSPQGHKSIWHDSATEQPYTGKRDYCLCLKDRETRNAGSSLNRWPRQIECPERKGRWVWATQLCYSYCHLITSLSRHVPQKHGLWKLKSSQQTRGQYLQ